MKIKIYVLLATSIISAMLLISCNRTSTPEDGTEASAQATEEITLETQPESGLSSPETDAEAATEHFETVEPAPEGKVHTAEVKVTAAGETPVEVTALTANSGKDKTHVRIALPLGYRCEGFVCGGVLYQGDVIPLALVGADAKVTLRIVYATYELPIVHITVNGQAIQSKTDYVDMTFCPVASACGATPQPICPKSLTASNLIRSNPFLASTRPKAGCCWQNTWIPPVSTTTPPCI